MIAFLKEKSDQGVSVVMAAMREKLLQASVLVLAR